MSTSIQFLFDYISPYAYLAWTQLPKLARRHGCSVEPIPVLFAGLLNANGQLGPAEVPSKRVYVFKDAMRSAHNLGLPLVPPPTHPFRPLLSLRVSCLETLGEQRWRVIDSLFHATWGSGAGVETGEQVSAVLANLGLDPTDIIAQASTVKIKQRLRDNTAQAIAAGVFGVPTMLIGGELFWGYDSFGHIDRFLSGKEALDTTLVQRWIDIRATAERRRERR